jgi:hypothetical protein
MHSRRGFRLNKNRKRTLLKKMLPKKLLPMRRRLPRQGLRRQRRRKVRWEIRKRKVMISQGLQRSCRKILEKMWQRKSLI